MSKCFLYICCTDKEWGTEITQRMRGVSTMPIQKIWGWACVLPNAPLHSTASEEPFKGGRIILVSKYSKFASSRLVKIWHQDWCFVLQTIISFMVERVYPMSCFLTVVFTGRYLIQWINLTLRKWTIYICKQILYVIPAKWLFFKVNKVLYWTPSAPQHLNWPVMLLEMDFSHTF